MSGTAWRPCIYGQKWPELFAQLPDDQTRHRVSEVLADSRLEGRVHTREDVSAFIDVELGRITAQESLARGKKRFQSQSSTRKIQGEDVSEAQIQEWVSEAEDGYDPAWLKSRGMGRPSAS